MFVPLRAVRCRFVPVDHVGSVAEAGPTAQVDRQDDGSVILTLPVAQREAFRSWVLGFLDHAEVVGPADLRDDLVGWLRSIVASAT